MLPATMNVRDHITIDVRVRLMLCRQTASQSLKIIQ